MISWQLFFENEFFKISYIEAKFKLIDIKNYDCVNSKCLSDKPSYKFEKYVRPTPESFSKDYYFNLAYLVPQTRGVTLYYSHYPDRCTCRWVSVPIDSYAYGKTILYFNAPLTWNKCCYDWVWSYWYIEYKKPFCCNKIKSIKELIVG